MTGVVGAIAEILWFGLVAKPNTELVVGTKEPLWPGMMAEPDVALIVEIEVLR